MQEYIRSRLIKEATSLPGLIAAAEAEDPELANMLVGKSLVAAKSPIGIALVTLLGYLFAKLGLKLDATTTDIIAFFLMVASAYITRALATTPIVGIMKASTPMSSVSAKVMAFWASVSLLTLSACGTPAQQSVNITKALSSVPGQLFCAIQTNGGGTMVASVIDAEASALNPLAAPAAVLVTGTSKVFVDAACQQAAAAVGGVAGIPVAPPAQPQAAPVVAIHAPKA